MLNVLFWNLNNRDCSGKCANLATLHEVSLFAVAECRDPLHLLTALNRKKVRYFPHPSRSRITLFTRYPPNEFVELESGARYCIHALRRFAAEELLVVTLHASSAIYKPDDDRNAELRRLSVRIREWEMRLRHDRTLVIGDFNAQPFDARMTSADHLHAVFSRALVKTRTRQVAGEEFPFFYNPSWKFFANRSPEPQGTYYYGKANLNNLFWYGLDQILIRPSLLPFFNDDELRILTTDGHESLANTSGRPNREIASDHFPIIARLAYPGV